MTDIAIHVENLSKRYRLGQREPYKTLRDTLARVATASLRALRRGGGGSSTGAEMFWALRDVTFEVKEGEVLGIIGRNGAGKSTLLKVLSHITDPTEGSVRMHGRVGSLLEVGTGFHPELTGRENVYLNGAILGMKRKEIDRRFDEIVQFSEIEKFLDTPVKRYSSGMYVRLAFAVAAHLEPEILLVDEVLAVGDAGFQKKCLGKIGSIVMGGRTVVFVSHQLNAIQGLCNRAIVMERGQISYNGETSLAIRHYLSRVGGLRKLTSLASRTDREGSGQFQFLNIRFEDGITGAPLKHVLSGQRVSIKVDYRSRPVKPTLSFQVSIAFYSEMGQFLFACSNMAVGVEFPDLPQDGTLICTIPKWPLTSGLYTFNLQSVINGEIADWIKEAGSVQVETGDFHGTGRVAGQSNVGIGVLIDYQWNSEVETTV